MLVHVPVSAGELVDKITILKIKAERLKDARKTVNVQFELAQLEAIFDWEIPSTPELDALVSRLQSVNTDLWDIEDEKRAAERQQCFGDKFIELARSVYLKNDLRAGLKRDINRLVGLRIIEEKSYAGG